MTAEQRLARALQPYDALAIAVSGGVDSMVLAHVATRETDVLVVHAMSPAVPQKATQRVRDHAAQWGWALTLLDAGEMADPRYLVNPSNRCFFCKENLYSRIRSETDRHIASGANLDDLSDYRPGLDAARHHGVVHPYIDAEITKAEIYAIAEQRRLSDLAALPAQPCLASRIETGIAVDPEKLAFIERVEKSLRSMLPAVRDARCRVTREGVVVELRPLPDATQRALVESATARLCLEAGRAFAGVRAYKRGSAFLRGEI